jgi:hypothetical protein
MPAERRPIGSDGPSPELVLAGGHTARSADGRSFTVYGG